MSAAKKMKCPLYDGWTVKLPNGSDEPEEVGCLLERGSVERLIACGAFHYEDDQGRISVRLERKARGSEAGYWVAYRRHNGRLMKAYVSEAYAVDPYNLHRAYRHLMA